MHLENKSPEFAKDFISLINSCKGLTYNANVSYGKTSFEYITLDKILNHIKENPSFAVSMPLGTNEQGQPALQIILMHKTGEILETDYYILRIPENAKKQDEGAAITYTKRYALGSFLGLCTDEDTDANPDGNGMSAKTPQIKMSAGADYRNMLLDFCKQNNIELKLVAQKYKLTKNSSQKEYEKALDSLNEELNADKKSEDLTNE